MVKNSGSSTPGIHTHHLYLNYFNKSFDPCMTFAEGEKTADYPEKHPLWHGREQHTKHTQFACGAVPKLGLELEPHSGESPVL